MDQGRQWATTVGSAHEGHKQRYLFAKQYANGRTLDAACGCGYGSAILLEDAKSVYGIDASPDAIAWAREHFPGPIYMKGKIEDSPWQGKFDTVVCLETIEHVPDPSPVLKALRKACRGKFIVSTPNENRYPFVAEAFANDESPHYRHYTPVQFDELLWNHGFRIISRHFQHGKLDSVKPGVDGMFMVYVCD
jgi:2-polyprenyl-3-methyl-5-hydroxy-6-metoxy-1,4-benzoquinol methylase